MARRSVGHVELQWTCPNCQTKNPGSKRTCLNCAAPQPDDVAFEQAAQSELITDEAKLKQAAAGPDIHCYYCGTRNPGEATNCSQCGADLTEGARRKTGQVVGAHRKEVAKPISCRACGTENDPNAANCVQCGAPLATPKPEPKPTPSLAQRSKARRQQRGGFGRMGVLLLILFGFIAVACVLFMLFSFRTESVTGRVQATQWERSINVEGLVPVSKEAWIDEVPADGIIGTCQPKIHHIQDNPASNSQEVCGTPYVLDEGSGFGEVVQDCRYQVYEDFCSYTAEEWRQVDTVRLDGDGLNAQWPALSLNETGQREGNRDETYSITFSTEAGRYTMSTTNFAEAQKYTVGSEWILEVNTFNAVVAASPAN